jgi:carbohydrate-selective porin OprB
LLLETKWDAVNRGADNQGSLVAVLDWRHTIAGRAEPIEFQFQTGSQWPSDFGFTDWDPWFASLYWEQHLTKNKFVMRVGNQVAPQFIDFFRYKDGRTSSTGSPYTAASASIPAPPPGFGASFRWTPFADPGVYVVGSLNDMNAAVDEFDWGNITEFGQFFYALELGKTWRRDKADFDHLHFLLFYADKRATAPAIIPNKAGGGFKLAGSKQWDRIVGFGSYTYNSAEGGGFGLTVSKQNINAGFAINRPLNVRGEFGVQFTWAEPIKGLSLVGLPQRDPLKDQYGMELYWKLLVTGDLWVTPSLQVIRNPTYNPGTRSVVIPGIKLRFFL